MNLGQSSIVLRHRPALEVVDLALRFVRSIAPRSYVQLTVLLVLPAWAALALLSRQHLPAWAAWGAAFTLARILEVPFTVLSGTLLFERTPPLKRILRESLQALPRFLMGLFLYGLLLTASFLLIIAPLFVGANYFFLSEVLILEKAPPLRAFKRSHQFLGGRSGTGIEGMLLRFCLMISFVILTETLGEALLVHVLAIQVQLDGLWNEGVSALSILGLFLSIPYTATHRFLAYTNERTRRDGWDVQVTFLQLASKHHIDDDGAGHEE